MASRLDRSLQVSATAAATAEKKTAGRVRRDARESSSPQEYKWHCPSLPNISLYWLFADFYWGSSFFSTHRLCIRPAWTLWRVGGQAGSETAVAATPTHKRRNPANSAKLEADTESSRQRQPLQEGYVSRISTFTPDAVLQNSRDDETRRNKAAQPNGLQ